MDFQFDEEQTELRETARAFLQEHQGSEAVRRAMGSELGYESEVWKRIGSELGWTSVHIPEEYGGLGLGHVELVALMEVMGESLLCAPFFSSVVLGANALLEAGSDLQKREWLPAIAEGERTATLAFAEPGSAPGDPVATLARREGDSFVLTGAKRSVVDGHSADLLVVSARDADRVGPDAIALYLVPGDSDGLDRELLPTMDSTRRLAAVSLDGVRLAASARLGEGRGGAAALERTLQLASVALAAEQVGGAQRCLDLAVDYAKERVQFGRPIGSFQAIKHKLADVMVRVESARSAAYYAGCVAAEGSDELPVVSSLARAYCSETYFQAASDCLQVHGGVGFTWEYDVHLHFKRARASEALLGSPSHHREIVARHIGL
ncbi:MAG: acyl-CoA dehydrogenase family protein [Myxococcota bacterium]